MARTTTNLILLIFVIFISCSKEEEEPKSDEKSIISFQLEINGQLQRGDIDPITSTIQFQVINPENLNLVPRVEISALASLSPAASVSQDFSKVIKYTVTAEDGSTQVYDVEVMASYLNTDNKLIAMTATVPSTSHVYESEIYDQMQVVTYRSYYVDSDQVSLDFTIPEGAEISVDQPWVLATGENKNFTVFSELGEARVYDLIPELPLFESVNVNMHEEELRLSKGMTFEMRLYNIDRKQGTFVLNSSSGDVLLLNVYTYDDASEGEAPRFPFAFSNAYLEEHEYLNEAYELAYQFDGYEVKFPYPVRIKNEMISELNNFDKTNYTEGEMVRIAASEVTYGLYVKRGKEDFVSFTINPTESEHALVLNEDLQMYEFEMPSGFDFAGGNSIEISIIPFDEEYYQGQRSIINVDKNIP